VTNYTLWVHTMHADQSTAKQSEIYTSIYTYNRVK